MLLQRLTPSRYWGALIFPSPLPTTLPSPPPPQSSVTPKRITHKWWLCRSLVSSDRKTCVTSAIFVHLICSRLCVNKKKKFRLEIVCINPANLSFWVDFTVKRFENKHRYWGGDWLLKPANISFGLQFMKWGPLHCTIHCFLFINCDWVN